MAERCGEILFIKKNNSFPIICSYCNEKFSSIKKFKEHYLSKHLYLEPIEFKESVVYEPYSDNVKESAFNFGISKSTNSLKKGINVEQDNLNKSNQLAVVSRHSNIKNAINIEKGKEYFYEKSFHDVEHKIENSNESQQTTDCIYKKESGISNTEKIEHFICENPKCDNSFLTLIELNEHKHIYHINEPVRPFKCSYCSKGFLCCGSLNAHVNTVHLKTRMRYKCSYCTKSFNILEKKEEHQLSHNGLKAYNCLDCGKRFCKKQQLQLHIRRNHLKEKRFDCSFCEKQFFDAGEKRKHERFHTGEKPYICEICSVAFTVRQKLNNHMVAKHSNSPKFRCDDCAKSFFIKDNFNRHKLIHVGEKKYMCEICSKTFYRNRELMNHMKIHKNHNGI